MNCVHHIYRPAACFCSYCKQPICIECHTQLGACPNCVRKGISQIRRDTINTIVLATVFAGLGIWWSIADEFDFLSACGFVIAFAALPFGWRALSKITSRFFLFLPIVGWVIYFFVKAFLALMIGWAVLIWQVIKLVKDNKNAKIAYNTLLSITPPNSY